jgi:hypothetical protein
MPASTVHVEPTPTGRWIVRVDDERESLSEHESATDAQRAACDLAQVKGAAVVLLHDRYSRVHRVPIDATATAKLAHAINAHEGRGRPAARSHQGTGARICTGDPMAGAPP